ncbi:MAG: TfoX/Sxy family protein [Anaerolineae bacterium]|nr:TfoX/Sxy family protein [Anaerolineae bacterium]
MERNLTKEEKAAIVRDFEMALQASLVDSHPETHITSKGMFGGAGFFVDGEIFAAWYGDDSVYLKLPEEARQKLLLVEGATTEGGHYVKVPSEFMTDVQQLGYWTGLSVDYVKSLPTKKRKSKK